MGRLIEIHDVDEFSRVRTIPDEAITGTILVNIADLHEIKELEKFLREIIYDPTETPHGPTEIADILTTHCHVHGVKRLAAFVLKGKSFKKVTSDDVARQFFKLRTVPDLGIIIFVAVGHIQDHAQRDFVQTARDANCDYLIVNAHQCARLLIAYEKICPQDGTLFDELGICSSGHRMDLGIALDMTVREKVRFTIANLEDLSHAGAKRYAAKVIVDRHYPRDLLREVVREATEQLKTSGYYRNKHTKARWGATHAHVVWLFIGHDLDDIQNANWVFRTCWIDPLLPKEMRPIGLSGNDKFDDIEISWNDQYEGMKEIIDEHQTDKGQFLELLQGIKDRMIMFGDKAEQLFSRYQQGDVTEEQLISDMQSLGKEADVLYRDSSNLPFPPPDCKYYHQACQNLFATVQDLFLYYSQRGLETWKKPNREWLIQNTVKRYYEDLQRIVSEGKKIH